VGTACFHLDESLAASLGDAFGGLAGAFLADRESASLAAAWTWSGPGLLETGVARLCGWGLLLLWGDLVRVVGPAVSGAVLDAGARTREPAPGAAETALGETRLEEALVCFLLHRWCRMLSGLFAALSCGPVARCFGCGACVLGCGGAAGGRLALFFELGGGFFGRDQTVRVESGLACAVWGQTRAVWDGPEPRPALLGGGRRRADFGAVVGVAGELAGVAGSREFFADAVFFFDLAHVEVVCYSRSPTLGVGSAAELESRELRVDFFGVSRAVLRDLLATGPGRGSLGCEVYDVDFELLDDQVRLSAAVRAAG